VRSTIGALQYTFDYFLTFDNFIVSDIPWLSIIAFLLSEEKCGKKKKAELSIFIAFDLHV
jgi:hypothetical protein